MKRFRRGLFVGKFCPLHRGHELVLERARAQCDGVLVVSYTKPEFARCEAAARERWLKRRLPDATVLVLDDERLAGLCAAKALGARPLPHNEEGDDAHRAFMAWLCAEVLGDFPDAVFTSEGYGDGFAAALSKGFTSARGSPMTVTHVSVDATRSIARVSGTAVRGDPHGHRRFLAPEVYAAFVERVGILGGESTGKSTLAEQLAARLQTAWVAEYGRELWERRNGRLDCEDMLHIARTQIEREEKAAETANRWVICDTTALTTRFYSEALFGRVDQKLDRLAERRYDRIFLCAPDFEFVQDGTRQPAEFRGRQHRWYLEQLERRRWPFTLLTGDRSRRLADAAVALGS